MTSIFSMQVGAPVLPEPVGADTTMLASERNAALKVALCTGLKYLHAKVVQPIAGSFMLAVRMQGRPPLCGYVCFACRQLRMQQPDATPE